MDEKMNCRLMHILVEDCEPNIITDGESRITGLLVFTNPSHYIALCPVTVTRTGNSFSSWQIRDDSFDVIYDSNDVLSDPITPRGFWSGYGLPTVSIDNVTIVDSTHLEMSGTVDWGWGFFSVKIGEFNAIIEFKLTSPVSIGK
jgi:hypothetical protein